MIRLRRFLGNKLSAAGLFIVMSLVVAVVVGPWIWDANPRVGDLTSRVAGMSRAHPLGTDTQGRDVLARMLHGGRTTLLIAVTAVLLATLVGGTLGLVSGYVRGWVDAVVMRAMDVLMSFPPLLLALIIAASRGPGAVTTVIAVAVPVVPRASRLMRAMVLSVREREYVAAARAAGIRPRRILTHHVLRNSVSPVIVQASIGIGIVILEIAGLGYLGVGIQAPDPEWGAILRDSQTYLLQRPEVLLVPGSVICLAIIGFNLVGDALGDVIDPAR